MDRLGVSGGVGGGGGGDGDGDVDGIESIANDGEEKDGPSLLPSQYRGMEQEVTEAVEIVLSVSGEQQVRTADSSLTTATGAFGSVDTPLLSDKTRLDCSSTTMTGGAPPSAAARSIGKMAVFITSGAFFRSGRKKNEISVTLQ